MKSHPPPNRQRLPPFAKLKFWCSLCSQIIVKPNCLTNSYHMKWWGITLSLGHLHCNKIPYLGIIYFPMTWKEACSCCSQWFGNQDWPYFYFWNTAIIYEVLCFSSGRTEFTMKYKGLGSLSSQWIVCIILCQWSASLNSYKYIPLYKSNWWMLWKILLEPFCFLPNQSHVCDHDHTVYSDMSWGTCKR